MILLTRIATQATARTTTIHTISVPVSGKWNGAWWTIVTFGGVTGAPTGGTAGAGGFGYIYNWRSNTSRYSGYESF